MKTTFEAKPADKKLTLGELRTFLASVDGAPDGAVPVVRINFGGSMKSITVTVDEEG